MVIKDYFCLFRHSAHSPITYAMLCYAKSLQSCPTLCDPHRQQPPGSSIPGILQARTLEWVAIAFSISSPNCLDMYSAVSFSFPTIVKASLVAQRLKRLPPMQETWVRSLGREDSLEKEMATHSSTLAWRIPWREEPGGLQSTRSQRVGHD